MTRWFAFAAATAGLAAGLATPTGAGAACVAVDKSGTVGPPLVVEPICVVYNGADHCRTFDLGLDPTFVLHVHTCTPRSPVPVPRPAG